MSKTPRLDWSDVARVLVEHSTGTQKGDRVAIIMRETAAEPLTRAVYRQCVQRGALPQVLYHSALLERDLMNSGSGEQVDWVPELYLQAMEWADVCIDLRGASNLSEFEGIDNAVIAAHRRAEGKVSARRTAETRWVICRVPTPVFAQQAGLSSEQMMELFYTSICIDWHAEGERLRRIQSRLQGSSTVRITAEGTDIRFSTAGRRYIVDDGHINMPGGEIFTAPVENSVEGVITFPHPGVFAGTLMHDIRLEFSGGRVVGAKASSNQEFLDDLLEMDEGARYVGEFGIGTNRQLTRFANDILWDEKIAGTVHLALGRSYTECGGSNQSSLHWDIVLDLRRGGEVQIDGEPFELLGSLDMEF